MNLPSNSVELVITALAVVVTAGALYWNVVESSTRATFDHMRAIQRRLERVWPDPAIEEAEQELIGWFGGDGAGLSERARAHLDLLTELDLFAFASAKGIVRTRLAREWLRSLFDREAAVSAAYLGALQEAIHDSHVFEHLLSFIRKEFPEVDQGKEQHR